MNLDLKKYNIPSKIDKNLNKDNKSISKAFLSNLYSNNLYISKALTPDIYKSLLGVCNNLGIDIDSIDAFIVADSNIQAKCILTSKKPILLLYSGLLNLMDFEEIKFIIGHELGHHFLNSYTFNHSDSFEISQIMKIHELSCDRIGLIGSRNLEKSLSCMIKTITGLNENLLRFDFSKFVSQIKKTSKNTSELTTIGSHPNFFVRARALLWFSMTKNYTDINRDYFNQEEINKTNKRVLIDLKSTLDQRMIEAIDKIKLDIEKWNLLKSIFIDNKQLKSLFVEKFDKKIYKDAENSFIELDKEKINNIIKRNLNKLKEELKFHYPLSFNNFFN